jgi:hypothetical protein
MMNIISTEKKIPVLAQKPEPFFPVIRVRISPNQMLNLDIGQKG